ncbi:hypothetical protein I3760_05G021900 [Carya illinoinensis]|nr:hypothetical protein I3760_05G021900 [Carya illinoinensis]
MMKHYNAILPLLDKCKTMAELRQLHGLMITTSVIKYVIPLSRLIDFCANSKAGDLDYAESVFSQIEVPGAYIWNSMIKAYSNINNPDEALHMYREMQRRDMVAGLKVFEAIPKWNVVAWTNLISGYVNNGWPKKAIEVYKEMEFWSVESNEITLVNVLVACSHSRDINSGKWVHSRICHQGYDPFESNSNFNIILATAIIDMYAKCGSLGYARKLFDKMPQKNLVAWNSMVGAYIQYGMVEEALGLFRDMMIGGFQPDIATSFSIIGISAHLGALSLGQNIHSFVLKTNIVKDIAVGTALLDMYAKVGDVISSHKIFCELQKKDTIAWTSMIIGLAMHEHAEEALSTFKRMQEDPNVIPDEITYIGVLFACSHLGLVEEGQRHFTSMVDDYSIEPTIEHYGCMVDLLSRAGRFEEAERVVKKMPTQPNIAIWGALLNGCEIHGNVNLADQLRSRITELEPRGSGVYVLLSNIYASVGKWQEAKLARELMTHRRIAKTRGHSTIELKLLNL